MAAYALAAVQAGAPVLVQADGLMPAVGAGNLAPSTANAGASVKFRIYDRIPLQRVRRIAEILQSLADKLAHAADSLFLQIIVQARLDDDSKL